jgi:hypothetical protein
MDPLYIFIHEDCVEDLVRYSAEAQQVWSEILHIKSSEPIENILIGPGDYTKILDYLPSGLSRERELRLCGAYYGNAEQAVWCLDVPLQILQDAGYNARIYEPASLSVLVAKTAFKRK